MPSSGAEAVGLGPHRIEEIFCAALDVASAERPAFLERVCAGDVALRREVEGLLGAQRDATPGLLQSRRLALSEALSELRPCLPGRSHASSGRGHERAAPSEPVLGSVIAGYRLVASLGKGGMGEVYLGVHEMTRERAAIKMMRAEQAHHGAALARFFAEAAAASRIAHPGVVRVYAHDHCASGRAYIVMEYLEGESLGERLRREHCLPVPVAVEIARQVAAALAAAHARGIIHRDLSPGNIFLTTGEHGRDQVKILDFGVAKLMDAPLDACSPTPIGAILGTPPYMSPEQCEGAPHVDHRTDLYALGCVLFAMLCGRPPFTSRRMGSVLAAHLSTPPPRPSALCAAVPGWLDEVVLRLLAKHRDERYRAAADVLDALSASAMEPCHEPGEAPGSPAVDPAPSAAPPRGSGRAPAMARRSARSMAASTVVDSPRPSRQPASSRRRGQGWRFQPPSSPAPLGRTPQSSPGAPGAR